MKAKAASAAIIAILESRNTTTMGPTRSIRLNAGGLDLSRPIAEVVADELHELLGRLAHQLERVGREQSARFRRDEGAFLSALILSTTGPGRPAGPNSP